MSESMMILYNIRNTLQGKDITSKKEIKAAILYIKNCTWQSDHQFAYSINGPLPTFKFLSISNSYDLIISPIIKLFK